MSEADFQKLVDKNLFNIQINGRKLNTNEIIILGDQEPSVINKVIDRLGIVAQTLFFCTFNLQFILFLRCFSKLYYERKLVDKIKGGSIMFKTNKQIAKDLVNGKDVNLDGLSSRRIIKIGYLVEKIIQEGPSLVDRPLLGSKPA